VVKGTSLVQADGTALEPALCGRLAVPSGRAGPLAPHKFVPPGRAVVQRTWLADGTALEQHRTPDHHKSHQDSRTQIERRAC